MTEAVRIKKETIQIPVSELIEIFENEAKSLCNDKKTASILAILSLVDFVENYGRDVMIG